MHISNEHSWLIQQEIAEWHKQGNPLPKVTSLDAETHLFHFDGDDWRTSAAIFVNKNGNQQRLIYNSDGYWYAFATWRSLFPQDDWEFKGLKGEDPERVIAKMSVGPGPGKSETLCFLPKEICDTNTRWLAYRYHMVALRKPRDVDGFFMMHPEGSKTSPVLGGKPWESIAATKWIRDEFGIDNPPLERGASNPFTREKEQEAVQASMEEHELYGAWG